MKGIKTKRPPLRFLWITDPWITLDHPKDTSLRLIEESHQLGYENYWCDVKSVRIAGQSVLLDAQRVLSVSPDRESHSFEFSERESLAPGYFHRLLYRPDPPVDFAYLHPLQMLDAAIKSSRSELVNSAAILFRGNEKFSALALPAFFPSSCVSARADDLERFGRAEKITVCKPLHQAQSLGIAVLAWKTAGEIEKSRTVLRELSENFTRPIMLQRYFTAIQKGEQRLWFIDGKLLAAARKIPSHGESIINMDHGGTLEKTELTSRDNAAARAIGRYLRSQAIRLAAVDLIDGFITDFNFTSPGLLAPMEKLLGRNLAQPVIQALAHSVAKKTR